MSTAISKKTRQAVYDKCGGHCAYCGCEITLKEMQVDHLVPIWRGYPNESLNYYGIIGGTNDFENLMPSCRQCNFYKGTFGLEAFRDAMKTLMVRVRKPFIYRLAEKYCMVQESAWDGKFYFEKLKDNEIQKETSSD